jgi:hypothetical protein
MRNRPATEHLAAPESRATGGIAHAGWRTCDAILLAAVVATAFLLGCYKLTDTDIWWHLRAGEWILANHRVPHLDPFTFGSADRVWIDLHWLFEAISAVAFRLAGIPGVMLLGAATTACSILVCVWRYRGLAPVAAACWIVPLILLGYRLHPRPELFSLVFVAVFLAVLELAERRPALVWVLPAAEVLWVNTHAFFVVGPVLYGMFLMGQIAKRRFASKHEQPPLPTVHRHHWAAFAALLAACLLNPYGLRGALLPLELFPKISNPANDYKSYIDELFSPFDYARRSQAFVQSHAIYYRSLYLLWLALPLSFVLPALWRTVRDSTVAIRGRQPDESVLRSGNRGLALALSAAVFGLACGAVTVLWSAANGWQTNARQALLVVVGLLWLAAAHYLKRTSLRAALLAVSGGAGQVLTTAYLQTAFAGSLAASGPISGFLLLVVGCWAAAAVLALQAGGDLFRMLLAAAFAYLGFQAVRNLNAFALVAGVVLAANMADWFSDLRGEQSPRRWWVPAGWLTPLGLAAVFVAWIWAIPTGHWSRWTNSTRQFGLGETPDEFAHEAARFAGRDGLPDRAIAFDLGMAALYVFHNSPDKKVYMDPRLEVPTLETFKNYVAIDDSLHGRDDVWRGALAELGEPLVLLDHRGHTTGEALLLADGGWRCVYYDSLGSVFVSSRSQVSTTKYPTVDFAERHFRSEQQPASHAGDASPLLEGESLVALGSELCRWPAVTWSWRVPSQWLALDRLDQITRSQRPEQDVWALRGRCYWNLVASFATAPPRAGDTWHNGASMRWAQATWCFQQALQHDARHATSLSNLYDTWRARRMPEAQLTAGRHLRALGVLGARQAQEIAALEQALATLNRLDVGSVQPAQQAVRDLVEGGFCATAADWVQRSGATTNEWDWQLVDQLAATWMQLGRPEVARALWEASDRAPSSAARLSRVADTWWVEGDLAKAERDYRAAIEADSGHPDSRWALAMLYADQGAAVQARLACIEALECDLADPQREELRAVLAMLTLREEPEHPDQK